MNNNRDFANLEAMLLVGPPCRESHGAGNG